VDYPADAAFSCPIFILTFSNPNLSSPSSVHSCSPPSSQGAHRAVPIVSFGPSFTPPCLFPRPNDPLVVLVDRLGRLTPHTRRPLALHTVSRATNPLPHTCMPTPSLLRLLPSADLANLLSIPLLLHGNPPVPVILPAPRTFESRLPPKVLFLSQRTHHVRATLSVINTR